MADAMTIHYVQVHNGIYAFLMMLEASKKLKVVSDLVVIIQLCLLCGIHIITY
jgi:hypothetical protein